MQIFKNAWFNRFAGKEGIKDTELKEIVSQLEKGQFDADLGGNVYKMRLARSGEGKSGGFRLIVLFKSKERTFFVYGFAKSAQGNINQKERKAYKEAAKEYFSMTAENIEKLLLCGRLKEIQEVDNER